MQEVARLYELYGRLVYGHLLRLTGNHELADELTQETFCRLITAVVAYRGEARILTWILGVARNVYRDEMKRRAKMGAETQVRMLETIASTEGNPVEELINQEQRIEVLHVLAELPDAYREVLLLKDYEGLNYDAIASVMGKSVNWARVTYFRAKVKFREIYSKQGGISGE